MTEQETGSPSSAGVPESLAPLATPDNDHEVPPTAPPPEPPEHPALRVFRKEHRELSPTERLIVAEIKKNAALLLASMLPAGVKPDGNLGSRELSVARTKLEESVMWAVKHWTG